MFAIQEKGLRFDHSYVKAVGYPMFLEKQKVKRKCVAFMKPMWQFIFAIFFENYFKPFSSLALKVDLLAK